MTVIMLLDSLTHWSIFDGRCIVEIPSPEILTQILIEILKYSVDRNPEML